MTYQSKVPPKVSQKKLTFFRLVQQELGKISWTTKKELIVYTKVVVMSTFVFGVGIYFADLVIKSVLDSLAAVIKIIGG